jgi:hypothetical protein
MATSLYVRPDYDMSNVLPDYDMSNVLPDYDTSNVVVFHEKQRTVTQPVHNIIKKMQM